MSRQPPALPEGLPPLPEGVVYLGKGRTFEVPAFGFHGWIVRGGDAEDRKWQDRCVYGDSRAMHYAANRDSEIVRLNFPGLSQPVVKESLTAEEADALRNENAELRRTKERLDWFDRRRGCVQRRATNRELVSVTFPGSMGADGWYDSLEEAIEAAIAREARLMQRPFSWDRPGQISSPPMQPDKEASNAE